ncbi:MAG: NMD3-related protein [Candidatus Micrarchaeia archaeon]
MVDEQRLSEVMFMVDKQCPKCGTSSKTSKFVGSICEKCYNQINRPKTLPTKITVYVCRECGANRVRHWDEDISHEIMRMLHDKNFGFPKVSISGDSVRIVYSGLGEPITIPLFFKKSICDSCARKLSGYYEAVVQLRGKYSEQKFVQRFMRKIERVTFVPRVEELKEGIDVYVGDKQAVRALLAALKLKPKVTHKLYGIKDGRKVYRTTFLVRG